MAYLASYWLFSQPITMLQQFCWLLIGYWRKFEGMVPVGSIRCLLIGWKNLQACFSLVNSGCKLASHWLIVVVIRLLIGWGFYCRMWCHRIPFPVSCGHTTAMLAHPHVSASIPRTTVRSTSLSVVTFHFNYNYYNIFKFQTDWYIKMRWSLNEDLAEELYSFSDPYSQVNVVLFYILQW